MHNISLCSHFNLDVFSFPIHQFFAYFYLVLILLILFLCPIDPFPNFAFFAPKSQQFLKLLYYQSILPLVTYTSFVFWWLDESASMWIFILKVKNWKIIKSINASTMMCKWFCNSYLLPINLRFIIIPRHLVCQLHVILWNFTLWSIGVKITIACRIA